MNEDVLYTPEEIAQKLKITKSTVYEMIKRGDLDAHRMGKHLRISNSQYEAYLSKAKGYENTYEGNIIKEDDEVFAEVSSVRIQVNTEFTGNVKISIRPEDIILSKGSFISSARNVHKGIVSDIIINGNSAKVILDIGIPLVALITKKSLSDLSIEKGTELFAIFKTMCVRVYK
ncbi:MULTISPECIES: excisionase family DNA-binding protein [unclassified Clostridium]|uniref:excisionase family DNA-binding protein n=1 Tax=unclassified Clostridium TaxID=2614128 RepID=UPI00291270AA|nr:excisionase family DNA-binding protein [Clostridium sp.]MDU5106340.1 excisionase family DNA-binding protein [Clostridium sp.]